MSTNKRRICFCISDVSACGGTERVSLKIANELCKCGYEVHFISLISNKLPYFNFDKRISFHVLLPSSLDKKLVHKRWYKQWKLNRILNKIKSDIVIDTTLGDIISQVVLSRQEKYISWVHFNYGFATEYPPHLNNVENIICNEGNMVVLSDTDRNMYINHGVPIEKIRTIYNPVTFEMTPNKEKRKKTVISIGRFSEEKGFDLLLRAWALVEKENDAWSLEIWGNDGRYENNLSQQAQELGLKRATLHGTTKDVGKILQKASIYVLSSRHESFGLVLLEASVCKLPLVAFDCPNGPRNIVKDGENGFLVATEDVSGLASAIMNLIKDEGMRIRMGERAFELSKCFSIDNIVAQWEDLFSSL